MIIPATMEHMADPKRGRGRPPVTDGEETLTIKVRVSASLYEQIQDEALVRGMTRKVRGQDAIGPDMGGCCRVLIEERLGN